MFNVKTFVEHKCTLYGFFQNISWIWNLVWLQYQPFTFVTVRKNVQVSCNLLLKIYWNTFKILGFVSWKK